MNSKILLFISLGLATFMMVLDYSIANVSIPYIAGSLAANNEEGTYVITSFAVGNAIGLAMTGWLTKRLGEIRLITWAIILFTIFSVACGLSWSLSVLVINRFIQGFVAGPVIPLSQSLLISHGTPESRSRDLAIWSSIVITAPVLGPILGGYLSDWYHWSWIFYINIPVGIFCATAIWLLLRKHETPIEKVPSDTIGIILLVIWVTCLQIFLDKGQEWDWFNSKRIWFFSITCLISLTFFILREMWHKIPFMELRLFKIPSFSLSIFCLMISYAIYFGTIVLVPLWLQEYMGYTAEWAGFAVCTVGIGPIFLTFLTPKVIKKVGFLWTLILGFTIFCIACFYTTIFTAQVDFFHIALTRFIFGLGFVFYINPLINMNVQDIVQKSLPSATGIFHFLRAMMGGVGTSVFTTLWIRRTIFHHQRVGSALTVYNPMTPASQDPSSLAQLNNSLDQQASILALNETFYLMGFIFLGLVLLLIFRAVTKRKTQGEKVAAESIAH